MKTTLFAAAALILAAGPALAQLPPGMTIEQAFVSSDANKDGVVTKDEAGAWPSGAFEAADTDKDGKVTLDEARANYAKDAAK